MGHTRNMYFYLRLRHGDTRHLAAENYISIARSPLL